MSEPPSTSPFADSLSCMSAGALQLIAAPKVAIPATDILSPSWVDRRTDISLPSLAGLLTDSRFCKPQGPPIETESSAKDGPLMEHDELILARPETSKSPSNLDSP